MNSFKKGKPSQISLSYIFYRFSPKFLMFLISDVSNASRLQNRITLAATHVYFADANASVKIAKPLANSSSVIVNGDKKRITLLLRPA